MLTCPTVTVSDVCELLNVFIGGGDGRDGNEVSFSEVMSCESLMLFAFVKLYRKNFHLTT